MGRLRSAKLALRALGACASTAFLLQAFWIFQEPRFSDLWQFCHWIGQAFLCVFAGFTGLYLEYKGDVERMGACNRWLDVNHIVLSVLYFWLGCYVMGFGAAGIWQKTLARFTGVLAWVVSVGDLAISCTGTTCCPERDASQPMVEPMADAAPATEGGLGQRPLAARETQLLGESSSGNWNTAFMRPFGAG